MNDHKTNRVMVLLSDSELALLDGWRREQAGILPRGTAIRELMVRTIREQARKAESTVAAE